MKELVIVTKSAHQTEQLAEKLGRVLKGGEVIELVADLGGGKTTFVRGLAHGLESTDKVASPTFTISKVYKGGRLEVHHFDFYRLQDAGLMALELQDIMGDHEVVVVVEWGDVVEDVLPKERIIIRLEHIGDETRKLAVRYPESMTYLGKALC